MTWNVVYINIYVFFTSWSWLVSNYLMHEDTIKETRFIFHHKIIVFGCYFNKSSCRAHEKKKMIKKCSWIIQLFWDFFVFSQQFIIDAVESFDFIHLLTVGIKFAWDYGFQRISPQQEEETENLKYFSPQYWLFSEDLKLMNCAVSSRSMINTWKKCVRFYRKYIDQNT